MFALHRRREEERPRFSPGAFYSRKCLPTGFLCSEPQIDMLRGTGQGETPPRRPPVRYRCNSLAALGFDGA